MIPAHRSIIPANMWLKREAILAVSTVRFALSPTVLIGHQLRRVGMPRDLW
jgi:hypothetical protein